MCHRNQLSRNLCGLDARCAMIVLQERFGALFANNIIMIMMWRIVHLVKL